MEYRYDAAGNRISKYIYNNSSTVTKSIEYIGGYVIENDILSYYSMAEGRVRNEGGGFGLSIKMEYFITDQQGNTRVSFEDNNGTVALIQENSYYAFGMQMAGAYLPSNPNKRLYNAGSEWQDDIEGLADYYSTFFREYDPIIGRFNGVDPMAEATDQITTYAYADNNPVMMNDPLGDTKQPTLAEQMQAEYRAWHDPRYGNGFFDRGWDLWGNGGEVNGGGSGINVFDFWSTYGGMKIRQGNDPRVRYKTNKWGEFGYWSYTFENDRGSQRDGITLRGVESTGIWTSLSGNNNLGNRLGGLKDWATDIFTDDANQLTNDIMGVGFDAIENSLRYGARPLLGTTALNNPTGSLIKREAYGLANNLKKINKGVSFLGKVSGGFDALSSGVEATQILMDPTKNISEKVTAGTKAAIKTAIFLIGFSNPITGAILGVVDIFGGTDWVANKIGGWFD